MVRLISMRNAIPTQSEVEGEPVVYAPVVLDISGGRDVIPMSTDLVSVLGIRLRVAEKEVSIVVTGKRTVEVKVALGVGESILNLGIQRPAESELQLVRALGPREVVANLVIVRVVVPGSPVRCVVRARNSVQVHGRDTAVLIRPTKQAIEGKVRGRIDQTLRDDVNAIAVVVEGDLVQQ